MPWWLRAQVAGGLSQDRECDDPLHDAGTIVQITSAGSSDRLTQVCGSRPGMVIESPVFKWISRFGKRMTIAPLST
jgi:hypothetical protein